MRAFVDELSAVHDITKVMRKAIQDGHTNLDLDEMQRNCPPVVHRVAVTHPETGRKALFVNRNSTSHIAGLSDRENELLFPFLCDHVRAPEFQCRFHWEPDSLAFWDNRAVQHNAVPDYHERRVMRRVTIAGPCAR
jgi:taurine dioxygenase